MERSWAFLEAVVLAIGFVYVFDALHRRNRNYRELWRMYRELQNRSGAA